MTLARPRSHNAVAVLLVVGMLASACSRSGDVASGDCVDAQPATPAALLDADGLDGTVAIVEVRLFDGVDVQEETTVVFANGQIVAVGPDVDVPRDALVLNGQCHTLMPGLTDAHTHTFDNGLERAVQFGVTTHLDMFTSPELIAFEQTEESANPHRPVADLFASGILGTVDGGHGTQFGLPVPTLDGPDSVEQWVQDRQDEGASFIKLVLEDFSLYGGRGPTLDPKTFAAAVEAAKTKGFLTVTHVSKLDAAVLAIESGTDGLAHLFSDVVVDKPTIELMLEEGSFVIPTTVVLAAQESSFGNRTLTTDPNIGPRLTNEESLSLRRPSNLRIELQPALDSLEALHQAGIPLLAGSDAPNPGTLYGASMHRELEYFVDAGMTPVQALASATSTTADTFDLDDRGRVEPGRIADLVLTFGDPTTDILDTRAIVAVWKSGIVIELETPTNG